jgi:Family of unknown function (DUF5681)
MPDLDLIKQGKQGVRDRRGRFARGRSGNPAGRPRGCRDHVNRAARLLLAGEGEALTRKAVELKLAGDRRAGNRSGSLTHRRRATDRGRG